MLRRLVDSERWRLHRARRIGSKRGVDCSPHGATSASDDHLTCRRSSTSGLRSCIELMDPLDAPSRVASAPGETQEQENRRYDHNPTQLLPQSLHGNFVLLR